MSGELGAYVFLPWLRQGISTRIELTDGTPHVGRGDVRVTMGIGGGPESAPVDVSLALFGPGDVTAFDTRAITRHWPRPDVFEVEANYFPLLELFPADLPWRYTPAAANAQDRLRPWLGLIVLRDDEIAAIAPPSASRPHATVQTTAGAPLPPIDQLWAWTHVHVDAADAIDAAALSAILDAASHRVIARLLCPRRLDDRTAYTAFLVPTFEATRRSVLGLDPDPALDQTAPAWSNDGTAATLPIFYRWRFETGERGDFASLAARIVARVLPATVGTRPMDESSPGMGLPSAASAPLSVESALRALESESTTWDAGERQTWATSLAALVNLPEQRLQQAGAPRTLAPPLYGRWHAATAALDPNAASWFHDLNADPRLRVAAALGWQIVQNDQQSLLAGAWAQVEAVRAANARLRQAQLAREAAVRLYDRHVAVRPPAAIALFTQALHARVLMTMPSQPPLTVRALTAQSPLRAGVLHPTYVRLARPLGPIGVRQGIALQPARPPVLERVNAGDLTVAPAPATPTVMVTPARATVAIAPSWLTPAVSAALAGIPHGTWQSGSALTDKALAVWPANAARPERPLLEAFLGAVRTTQQPGGSPAEDLKRRVAARSGALTAAQIAAAPPRPGFVARELTADGTLGPLHGLGAPEDTRFRGAAAAAFKAMNVSPDAGDSLQAIDVAAAGAALAAAIDPRQTIAATFARHLHVTGTPWHPPDPLDPVMAAPAFPQPLYKPLFDISAEWILAGFDDLPQDSATLARVNERFIEAYMVGANDEMGRTLLFDEYPTDQRGTYFRQFWDVSGVEAPAPDVEPITEWPATAPLGANSNRPQADFLVLLVRAELLRRYPNLVVYAVEAQWNDDGSRSVPADNPVELSPEFVGTMGTGASFWGFALTRTEARGADAPALGAAGWFFALQEHPSEPRFGLEPPASAFAGAPDSWQKLRWSDVAADQSALAAVEYPDLGAALPNVGTVVDPKHAAWHVADGARASDLAYITYREPSRLLVHATRMIPPDAD